MRTLDRYVFGALCSSFVLAFLVLSFVLTIGLLVQIVTFIMDGVPMAQVGEFCLVSIPETLQWSMPLALLVSSVLVFSRLSADSEIAAMRACGINLLAVMKWPLLLALGCTLLGFFVNNEIVPRGHEVRRTLKSKVSVGTALNLMEPGRVIDDLPKAKFYFGRKEGNWLYDLVVLDYSDPRIDRMITAEKALVVQSGRDVSFELYRMTVDPIDFEHPGMMRANRFVYTIKDAIKPAKYTRRTKDLGSGAILAKLRQCRQRIAELAGGEATAERTGELELLRRELSEVKVEFHKRLVFALASVCFVLVGIPLGIRSQRRESSIGMAISLAVALGYYALVILALSFHSHYALHPELLLYLPVVLCLALAARLVPHHM